MATACDTENRMSEQNRFKKSTGTYRQDARMSVMQDCCTSGAYATNTCCIGTGLSTRIAIQTLSSPPTNHHLLQTLLPASKITSSYHQYVEAVKHKLTEKQVNMTRIKLALQYILCFQNSANKQAIFSRSSSLLQAEDIAEIFKVLGPYSSWFNHGFVTHLATHFLDNSGIALKEDYLATMLEMESSPLAILPRLSSTTDCPAEFEQVLVKIEKFPNAFTLQSILETIKNISDIFGLRSNALLLSSISASAVKGSTLVLWIPQVVSTSAISNASQNAHTMLSVGVLSITAKYEIITPAVRHMTNFLGDQRSREVTDSGCDTFFLSNTSEGDSTAPLINQTQLQDYEDFDDVFLTAISSSSSSYVSNNSTCAGTVSSVSVSSSHHQPNKGRNTPTLSPLAEKTDTEEEQPLMTSLDKDTEKTNDQIERKSTSDPDDQILSEDLKLMNIMGEGVKLRRSRQKERLVLASQKEANDSNESTYVPMESAPKVNLPTTTPRHLYSNVHPKVKQQQSFSYCITKTKPTGFVSRVLIRASRKWPANLQMVSISSQSTSKDETLFQTQLGQRLTALYIEDQFIVAADQNGQTGKVPVSSCRISKVYYGNRSKAVKLASSKLYNCSTINIQNTPSTAPSSHSPYGHSSPVNIDMVTIKAYQSQSKDEMTVQVGDNLRVLYCDYFWVYAANQRNQAGFIPRENCRLKRRSEELLKHCQWLTPNLPFQSDFVLDMAEPPPQHLVENRFLDNKDQKEKVVIMRNYVPPGTSCTFRRGLCVQVLYREENRVLYVATSVGKCFWIPAAYCLPTLPQGTLPGLSRTVSDDSSHTSSRSGKSSAKKKVSFAKNAAVLVETAQCYRSNPDLSVIKKEDTSDQYAFIAPRRTRSQDSFPPYLQFLQDLSPESTSCSCFFCF